MMDMKNKYYVGEKLMNDVRSNFVILAVETVIDFGGKVLLVKRKEEPQKGRWYIPGCMVVKAEDIKKAAIRAAKEETGIDCKIVRQLPHSREIFRAPGPKDGIYDAYCIVFLMKPKNKRQKIRLDHTSSDYRFAEKIEPGFDIHLKKTLAASKILKV